MEEAVDSAILKPRPRIEWERVSSQPLRHRVGIASRTLAGRKAWRRHRMGRMTGALAGPSGATGQGLKCH